MFFSKVASSAEKQASSKDFSFALFNNYKCKWAKHTKHICYVFIVLIHVVASEQVAYCFDFIQTV